VATIRFFDRADEFRIELTGRFSGDAIQDVRKTWQEALLETSQRRFSVDISGMTAYDLSGRKLLAEMYRHGMNFAARTPASLVFLDEIANTPRATPRIGEAPNLKPSKRPAAPPFRVMASGE
jgi:hypothetical protein